MTQSPALVLLRLFVAASAVKEPLQASAKSTDFVFHAKSTSVYPC